MIYDVVKVKFSNSNKTYFFSTNGISLKNGQEVIVDSEKGTQFGWVFGESFQLEDKQLIRPLKNVIRKATKEDVDVFQKNEEEASKAMSKAKTIVGDLGLKMRLLNASFTFDRKQLVFNFVADDRVDFRELAKKLASIYRTRIELRQIGVRDKAREVGGLGPCGRFLCCNLFLNNFESVSINMAKNQYISLKPDKINGICGRLLCCLNYEDDQYIEMKKNFPPLGTILQIGDISGKVISHNLFNQTFDLEQRNKTVSTIKLEEYESYK